MKCWTEQEEQYLDLHYKKQPRTVTAMALNRSEYSVFNKAVSMGITRQISGEDHKWTKYSDHDIALARALAAEEMPVSVISKKLEIPIRTLYFYIRNTDKRPTQALT